MENLSRIISAGTGPIIVISACGLLCLAYYNRLSGLVSRLRLFHRERLKEQEDLEKLETMEDRHSGDRRTSAQITVHHELLESLEMQTAHLMRRAHLIHKALCCFLLTIACLSICSLILGLSVLWEGLIVASVVFFVAGMFLLIVGVVYAMKELRKALQPVELESKFVSEMLDSIARLTE